MSQPPDNNFFGAMQLADATAQPALTDELSELTIEVDPIESDQRPDWQIN